MARAKRTLEQGGAKVTELEILIAQAEQFAWGPADVTAGISEMHERLKDAKQWVAQVCSQQMHHPSVSRPSSTRQCERLEEIHPGLRWISRISSCT